MKINPIIGKAKGIEWKIFDNEALVLNPRNVTFFKLNKTSTFLWEAINDKRKRNAILKLMVKEFKISKARAEKDFDEFLNLLKKHGLIRFH